MSDHAWSDYLYDFAFIDGRYVILRRGGNHKRGKLPAWHVFLTLEPEADGDDARRIMRKLNLSEDQNPVTPTNQNGKHDPTKSTG